MGLLEKIVVNAAVEPPRLLVYGLMGVGKSTFAAQAPKPVFIQTEDGLGRVGDTPRFPLARTLEEVFAQLDELLTREHPFQTVVIDTLDWLEQLAWERVCQDFPQNDRNNLYRCIEKVDGGYARGYVHALAHWRRLIAALTDLRARKNMAVVLLAHARAEKFETPDLLKYDRYAPKLHKHAAALLTEWCDGVWFAHWKGNVQTDEQGNAKLVKQATRGDERVLVTCGGLGWLAKSRYRTMPAELPLSWNEVEKHLV